MKKAAVLLMLGLMAWQQVFADDESFAQKTGKGIKKGGEEVGRGVEKGAEATGKGLKKAGEWIEKKVNKGGDK